MLDWSFRWSVQKAGLAGNSDVKPFILVKLWSVMVAAGLLLGCDALDTDSSANIPDAEQLHAARADSVPDASRLIEIRHLVVLIQSDINQSVAFAHELKRDVEGLLSNPSEESLQLAQQSWQRAYLAFLSFRVLAYLPITEPQEWQQQGRDGGRTYGLLDSWPITGGYIDHVPGYPVSGIVNDLTLDINAETLMAQQGFSSEYDISVGFHALAFLLFGGEQARNWNDFVVPEKPSEQSSATSSDALVNDLVGGPADAVDGIANDESLAPNSDVPVQYHQRRRDYLITVSHLLVIHQERLQRRWSQDGHYTRALQASDGVRVVAALRVAIKALIQKEVIQHRLDDEEWLLITGRQPQQELNALQSSVMKLVKLLAEKQPNSPLGTGLASWNQGSVDTAFNLQAEREKAEQLLKLLQRP